MITGANIKEWSRLVLKFAAWKLASEFRDMNNVFIELLDQNRYEQSEIDR